MMRASVYSLVFIIASACGADPRPAPPGGDGAVAMLSVDPPTSMHVLVNGVPDHQQFTVTMTAPDGTQSDVTAETTFSVDGGFGTFNSNDLTITSAGQAEVIARVGDATGSATVIARLESVRVDPTLPPNTPGLFTGPETSSLAPAIVYPPDNVAVPRNLGDFETHWTAASGLDIFEVSLATDYTDVRIYVPGGNGVPGSGSNPSWAAFLPAEWEAAVAAATTLQFRVRAIASSDPSMVHAGPARTAFVSNEPMEGGIYYWSSGAAQGQSGSQGIFRHDMSKPGQPAEQFWTTTQSNGRCVACHALSRDGSRMAVTYDGGNGAGTVIDVGTGTAQPVTQYWNFSTLTPDGSQLLTVRGWQLSVRDASTQAVIATMQSDGPVTHPELSPDGTKLVYIRPLVLNWDWMFGRGQIFTRSYDAVTHAFGPEVAIVTDGQNNYYPSWSPDSQWIVFTRSDDATGNGAYDNVSAEVWVVKSDGSSPPIPLSTANLGLGLTNSWARWAPFQQTNGTNQEPMFWITVSSKRDFGTRLINTGLAESQKFPQLWMMAFYPDRVGTTDPSSPAFRLPFQDLATRNHSAQWTEQIVVIQ